MTKNTDIEATYLEYLDNYKTLSLATADVSGSGLDCSTVCFALSDNGCLIIATDANSQKAKNLGSTEAFSCALDDGVNVARGIKLSGRARKLQTSEAIEKAKTTLTTRIPSIKHFFDNENIEFFELQPERRVLINFGWGINWKLEIDG
jgi:pyridoxine/pyridoxamine 5'-phosphate oxidase